MDAGLDPAERSDGTDPPPARRTWLVAAALIAASLILHAGLLFALLIAPDRTPKPEPDIIPVEIVIEPPKPPAPKAAANAAPESTKPPAAAPKPVAPQAAQPDKAPDGQSSPAPTPPPADAPARFDGLPASFRAVTLPATSIGGTEAASYKAIVFGLLAAAKQYPEAARAHGATGAAVVAFAVDTGGHLVRASLARSSGDADLDAEALATVRRCNPFPPPPQGAQTSFAAAIEFGSDP